MLDFSKAKDWEIVETDFDQLILRFAQYHLQLMTPAHDNRMNIGAKGFSGEGYKGHTFWDTEIFILPYFIFTMPEVARSLEEYRYLSLPGAHEKALLIDLDNRNPHSSDAGLHAASYGGLWQCAVYGFGGLRMLGGRLLLRPALPRLCAR